MGKKLKIEAIQSIPGSGYPAPFDEPCRHRERKQLGNAASLTQFGVNLLRLPPGSWSSQRHWHSAEDEFVFILEGEVVLVTDDGEEVLSAGECAGFRANEPDGHHLQNRSSRDAAVLEVGSRSNADATVYPDIDMIIAAGTDTYTRRDGTPYSVDRDN